ncbi:MAG: kinase [Rhodospirillales bacterium]
MIITRTPLRISLGGGGTDLPSYYEKRGGFVLSAAINKYIYITANKAFRPGYLLKYAQTEQVQTIEEIQHDIFREVLRIMNLKPGVELVSIADVPAGTGMGSSGSFTVGLLHALHSYQRLPVSARALAETANHIEMTVLGEPCGKQDHYIAAYGGLLCQTYDVGGDVSVEPLSISGSALRELSEGLMLFFTGYSREASALLADQAERTAAEDTSMLEGLDLMKDIGLRVRDALEQGDNRKFAALMHEHWESKRKRSRGMSSGEIDRLYGVARDNGSLGGKLVGAGGGGFLLFFTENRSALRKAMVAEGLQELDFSFDFDGSITQLRN